MSESIFRPGEAEALAKEFDNKFPPRLQQADPWDMRQGIHPVAEFEVDCFWTPVNEDWATARAQIRLHDDVYWLSKEVEIRRVKHPSHSSARSIEVPIVSALSWTKWAVGSGGVPVLGMYERNPGHILDPDPNKSQVFKWWASVGSRLSVAVVRLDGNLAGQARLVLVE